MSTSAIEKPSDLSQLAHSQYANSIQVVLVVVNEKEKSLSDMSIPKSDASTAKEFWKTRIEKSKESSSYSSDRKPPIVLPKKALNNDTSAISTRIKSLDTSKILNQYTGAVQPQLNNKCRLMADSTEKEIDINNSSSNIRFPTMSRPSISAKVKVTDDSAPELNNANSTSSRRNPTRKLFKSDTVEQMPTEVIVPTLLRTKSLMPASKSDISKLLDKKRRTDPIGLMKAQSTHSLGTFLADDLRASGFDPASVSFG